jgi:hypothetical protein
MNSLGLKPTLLAVALTLASGAIPAQAADAPAVATSAAPAWIATSNRYAQVLLQAQAKFSPEGASS